MKILYTLIVLLQSILAFAQTEIVYEDKNVLVQLDSTISTAEGYSTSSIGYTKISTFSGHKPPTKLDVNFTVKTWKTTTEIRNEFLSGYNSYLPYMSLTNLE